MNTLPKQARQPSHAENWYSGVPRSIRRQTILGMSTIVIACGGFATWATTAPLSAAVIAEGRFVPTGQNKTVQHLEGGIIEALLVAEGDVVEAGDALVRLDPTAAIAKERALSLRELRLRTMLARLEAEARGDADYEDPAIEEEEGGVRLDAGEVQSLRRSQRTNFEAARRKLDNDVDLLGHNVSALRARIEGYNAQNDAIDAQIALLRSEEQGKRKLMERGLIRLPEVQAVSRAIADAKGDRGRITAQIAEAAEQIARNERQIIQARAEARQAALDEVQAVSAQLDDVREERRAATAVAGRTLITAPVRGVVFQLHFHTPGGVIESGRAIAEIMPLDAPLVVEALVPRMHVDEVRLGQRATVRLSALNQRTTPLIEGEVIYVSADTVAGAAADGAEMFLARIDVPAEEIVRATATPMPGMPAEILIRTHERTFFDYLSKPVRDSMARAFSEE